MQTACADLKIYMYLLIGILALIHPFHIVFFFSPSTLWALSPRSLFEMCVYTYIYFLSQRNHTLKQWVQYFLSFILLLCVTDVRWTGDSFEHKICVGIVLYGSDLLCCTICFCSKLIVHFRPDADGFVLFSWQFGKLLGTLIPYNTWCVSD